MECCRQRYEKHGNETQEITHASPEHVNLSVLPQHAMPAMFWHIGNMLNGAESTPHMLWNTQRGKKNGNDTPQTMHASQEHGNLSVLP